MKTKKIIILSIISFIFLIQIENSYGHGWGIDTTLIDLDGRKLSVSVELPLYDDESDNKKISITAIDKATQKNVNNVTFLIGLYQENKTIFRNYFFTDDGNLLIHIIPSKDNKPKIKAEKDSLLGAWYATDSQPIQLEGNIFESGGLFNFEIEIRTIDEPTNIVEGLGIYSLDVSMVETKNYEKKSINGNLINFKTKSYFDKLSDFDYDSENKLVSFKMPFNWNEKIVSHVPVVHEEVHFPKDFAEYLTPSYTGKINGIDLFKSNVIIDDYTEEKDRIVHFVLLQDHLQYLKEEQKKINDDLPDYMLFTLEASDSVKFPMSAMTRDERFQIDLSWDPIVIEPGINTKFVFTIRDGITGEPLRQSTYDFIILQNNVEIYKNSGNAAVGGQFEDYTFLEGQSGPTVIRFENIRGTGSSTEFGLVVVPEFGVIASLILVGGLISVISLHKKFFN
ncbi:MAG TPA: peptidase [Nitrosopumilaceae archaeon]|nr:peptidase [Nitrosopumilaceae archaeon]